MAMKDSKGDCRGYEELLSLYFYDELDHWQAEDVARHAEGCPSCKAYLEDLREITATIDLAEPSRYESLRAANAVMARIKHRNVGRKLIPAFATAGALAVGLLFFYGQPANNHVQPATQMVAQADWDLIENYDVLGDLDTIEGMDHVEAIEGL
jgi:anti-sigma factor RsiW